MKITEIEGYSVLAVPELGTDPAPAPFAIEAHDIRDDASRVGMAQLAEGQLTPSEEQAAQDVDDSIAEARKAVGHGHT